MLSDHALAVLAACSVTVSAFTPCPLLGPVFDAPSTLCEASIFQAALKNLTAALDYAGLSGGRTPYGDIPTAATSFAIGVFDNDSTLLPYQYSSPALNNGTTGAQEVTEDSVFR
ncbi:hypothetical protein LTR53_017810, partial [Teratosphaeriaceae sp. CCFEE 6253]